MVIEFHEVQDTGELRLPLVGRYSRLVGGCGHPARLRVHGPLGSSTGTSSPSTGTSRASPWRCCPTAPTTTTRQRATPPPAIREAPADVCNILFFGIIRPYKGLEDLVAAFDRLTPAEVEGYWLTVVGETWEGHTLPAEMLARSPYRDRITFVNRYVHDAELDAYLRGADAVALPYRRSSLSGPLHVAMGYGLPIVMTDTGGNGEAAEGYEGILLDARGRRRGTHDTAARAARPARSGLRAPPLVDRHGGRLPVVPRRSRRCGHGRGVAGGSSPRDLFGRDDRRSHGRPAHGTG